MNLITESKSLSFNFFNLGFNRSPLCTSALPPESSVSQNLLINGHRPYPNWHAQRPQVAKNFNPPTPSLPTRRGVSQKIVNMVFLFDLINIRFSSKQLYNKLTELKHMSANGSIYHLFLTDCFFLSTQFANTFFKRGFNSYTKYMQPFFTNVTLKPIDHTRF